MIPFPKAEEFLNARDVCRRIAWRVRRELAPSIRLVLELSPHTGEVRGESRLLDEVLLHLIGNACEAMPDGGNLLISTSNVDHETTSGIQRFVRIVVADNGPGIASEIRGRIFDPGFTTRQSPWSHGMGLPIADRIVRASGGEMNVRSNVGLGSSFEILLPRVGETDLTIAATMPRAA